MIFEKQSSTKCLRTIDLNLEVIFEQIELITICQFLRS